MNKKNKPLIILTGPTAVGKTALSLRLAKAVNGEIISADSMQVYKQMDIGTAKIMPDEMQGVKHYLVDEFMPDEDFNVVKFKELALSYMEEIYAKGKIPIIVGGTGFYIQAILNDIDFTATEEDTSYRESLQQIADEKGADFLYEQLREVDEEATKTIHKNNVKRVIRALEYYHQTGNKISEHNEEQRQKESPYNFAYFVLNHNRDILYNRIEQRIDLMMAQGLLEEVTALSHAGYSKELVSMQGLGYKEIIAYLEGECTLEEAIYILKRDTRHFAKRQLTWFKREKEVIWLDKSEFNDNEDAILEKMCDILREKNIQ
ncbi:tRNA (adenosine(37)-N6)-dimethylallyltransferase MiaA [Anaerosporobacter sp.]|uniref:tRNA (adenosine(37)-N6)-dimethylallyltransferase MiaA n=1 Tax=Anaerosporobacter sp. TaxID=1872529 RepID=UPI00286F54C1|nr:tRNA (adenosine(37)-N6)-dimethylallyltransferase MiaA [Anaerosporobacter sp.]